MFVNFRRIRKCKCAQLLAAGLVLCALMVSWEEVDHHVVSHIRSYMYRYLVNSYDFSSVLAVASSQEELMSSYPYLINHPDTCAGESGQEILLLLFVKSSPENSEQRRTIRDTWGNESFAWSALGARIRVLFALGVRPDVRRGAGVQTAVLQEDAAYRDLIQRDFADTFHNLTQKLLLQLHWAHQHCPQARFFMSADDDVFIHLPNLVSFLHGQAGARGVWVGHVHKGSPPVRYKKSKYHVPEAMYPWPSYPDYTAGGAYVLSADVVSSVYQATLALNSSMHIDDVFMGICARSVGVSPQNHVFFAGEAKAPNHPCFYGHMITSHGHTTDMRVLWRAATDPMSRLVDSLYCTAVKVFFLCRPHFQRTYSCMAAFS